ncbi:hypothetical protein AZE42_11452 [Rhizopogon vesiculosus]|uniref:Uncharacterized protein n=1 Tax=Rhizopogon vesiculosus TaxID=180088 RepID=A0A1J8PH49_9AGAM|nr:hypothetical protein AZE42_11452 [Rhizopogon vesiculosus]
MQTAIFRKSARKEPQRRKMQRQRNKSEKKLNVKQQPRSRMKKESRRLKRQKQRSRPEKKLNIEQQPVSRVGRSRRISRKHSRICQRSDNAPPVGMHGSKSPVAIDANVASITLLGRSTMCCQRKRLGSQMKRCRKRSRKHSPDFQRSDTVKEDMHGNKCTVAINAKLDFTISLGRSYMRRSTATKGSRK